MFLRSGKLTFDCSNFPGGFPMYEKECRGVLDNNWKGFETVAPAVKA